MIFVFSSRVVSWFSGEFSSTLSSVVSVLPSSFSSPSSSSPEAIERKHFNYTYVIISFLLSGKQNGL